VTPCIKPHIYLNVGATSKLGHINMESTEAKRCHLHDYALLRYGRCSTMDNIQTRGEIPHTKQEKKTTLNINDITCTFGEHVASSIYYYIKLSIYMYV
jgi:hypothetical protein